ncbi:MAG: zinc metallopeptidase [Oscillospiraceae bacterium]|nr:zinc metallopeptidase [Oscillospiraceae bacterium]
MFYYGYDLSYLILVLPAVLFALWASSRVNKTFEKYNHSPTLRGMTGAQAAQEVLRSNGVYGVRIERVSGELTDHYDPKANVIRLSESVHDRSTPAAIGVAAHEAGHAVQYATNYGPIKFRASIVNITNIASKLSMPLIIISILLMSLEFFLPYQEALYKLAMIGVLAFGMSAVFQLVTLPTEYNASRRALASIESSRILTEQEQYAAKQVLSAAALTYVAALAVSLAQLLRIFLMVYRFRRDD